MHSMQHLLSLTKVRKTCRDQLKSYVFRNGSLTSSNSIFVSSFGDWVGLGDLLPGGGSF